MNQPILRCLILSPLLAAALAAGSCRSSRSLILFDVLSGDQAWSRATLRLVANGSVRAEFADASFDTTDMFAVGMFLPPGVSGVVTIEASIEDGGCVRARSLPPPIAVDVAPGATSAPVVVRVYATPDCAAGGTGGAAAAGTGGARAGTGGAVAGAGGAQAGTGGAVGGTGGQAVGTGGARAGTGGAAAGTGGRSGETGGAVGGTGGQGVGTGGARAGTGGAAAGTGGETGGGCGALIDDMEAGTGFICEGSGRIGSWFTYRDEASMITPPPSQVPALPVEITSRPGSRRAMYAYGTTTSYAGLGCVINNSVIGERPGTFDASRYQGIRFSGRSSNGWIKLAVHTPATVVVTNGGTCPATLNCIANQVAISVNSSIWNDITVPFARLEGGAAPFDPSQIWSIEFQSYVGSFDVWVDDLSFY